MKATKVATVGGSGISKQTRGRPIIVKYEFMVVYHQVQRVQLPCRDSFKRQNFVPRFVCSETSRVNVLCLGCCGEVVATGKGNYNPVQ